MSENTKLSAAIIGASGLVGTQILNLLLEHPNFETVKIIVRKPLSITHPKLEQITIDFSDLKAYKNALTGSEIVFCAIGTTLKKVKSDKTAYRKIDYDIPVHAAQICKELNCTHFSLVSAIGANWESNNFYLQLKGEVEKAVKELQLSSVAFFRPSLLLGNRKEFRLGEVIGTTFFKLFSFLIPSKYKGIQDKELAQGMIKKALESKQGAHIYHYKEIVK